MSAQLPMTMPTAYGIEKRGDVFRFVVWSFDGEPVFGQAPTRPEAERRANELGGAFPCRGLLGDANRFVKRRNTNYTEPLFGVRYYSRYGYMLDTKELRVTRRAKGRVYYLDADRETQGVLFGAEHSVDASQVDLPVSAVRDGLYGFNRDDFACAFTPAGKVRAEEEIEALRVADRERWGASFAALGLDYDQECHRDLWSFGRQINEWIAARLPGVLSEQWRQACAESEAERIASIDRGPVLRSAVGGVTICGYEDETLQPAHQHKAELWSRLLTENETARTLDAAATAVRERLHLNRDRGD